MLDCRTNLKEKQEKPIEFLHTYIQHWTYAFVSEKLLMMIMTWSHLKSKCVDILINELKVFYE